MLRLLAGTGLALVALSPTLQAPAPRAHERLVPVLVRALDRFERPNPDGAQPAPPASEEVRNEVDRLLDDETVRAIPNESRFTLSNGILEALNDGTFSSATARTLRALFRSTAYQTGLDRGLRAEVVTALCGRSTPDPTFDRAPFVLELLVDEGRPREAFFRQPREVQSTLIASAAPHLGWRVVLLETPGFEALDAKERSEVLHALGAAMRPPREASELWRYENAAQYAARFFGAWRVDARGPDAASQVEVLRAFVRSGRAPFLEDSNIVGPPEGEPVAHEVMRAGGVPTGVRIGERTVPLTYPSGTVRGLPDTSALATAIARRSPEELGLLRGVELMSEPRADGARWAVADAARGIIRLYPSVAASNPFRLEQALSEELGVLVGHRVLGPNGSEPGWRIYVEGMQRDLFLPRTSDPDPRRSVTTRDFADAYARHRSSRRGVLTRMFEHRFAVLEAALDALRTRTPST